MFRVDTEGYESQRFINIYNKVANNLYLFIIHNIHTLTVVFGNLRNLI